MRVEKAVELSPSLPVSQKSSVSHGSSRASGCELEKYLLIAPELSLLLCVTATRLSRRGTQVEGCDLAPFFSGSNREEGGSPSEERDGGREGGREGEQLKPYVRRCTIVHSFSWMFSGSGIPEEPLLTILVDLFNKSH